MGKIESLIGKIKKLTPERQTKELLKIIKRNGKAIVRKNVDQLNSGLTAKGTLIVPPYKESTKKAKRRKGQPTHRVTLKNTGAFHKGIFIDADTAPVLFSSHDHKTSELVEKYGEEIFGLTDWNKEIVYKEILQDEYREFIRKFLFL